jgi:hypothetical protein
MNARPTVRRLASVDQVAVVVPLDVTDPVVSENVEDRIPDVRISLRDAHVDHLLMTRLLRQAVAGGHNGRRTPPRAQRFGTADHL